MKLRSSPPNSESLLTGSRARPTSASGLSTFTAVAVLVALLAIPTLVGTEPTRSVMASAGLLRTPASFIELDFPDVTAVEDFTAPSGMTSVVFALTNSSPDARTISWTASVERGAEGRQVASRAVRLEAGESVVQSFDVKVACDARRVVDVRATSARLRAASVHFFVLPLQGPPRPSGTPYCTSNPSEAAT